jgi:hypothetical protein
MLPVAAGRGGDLVAWFIHSPLDDFHVFSYSSGMPDERAQPYEGLTRWLHEDTGDDPSMPGTAPDERDGPRRGRIRAIALALPWLVTLAVLAATTWTGDAPAGPPPAAPASEAGEQSHPPTAGHPIPDGGAQPPDGLTASAAPDGDGQPPDDPAATSTPEGEQRPPDGLAAIATGLVRDAITGQRGDTVRAVDVATAEPADPLGGDHWLVRVRAVVLRGDTRRWRSAAHEVWAVPMAAHAGQVIGVDRPWRVSSGRPRITVSGWGPASVDRAAVTDALHRSGTRPADDLDPQRHPDLGGIIRVRTAAGGGSHVWLATEPHLHVLGAGPGTTVSESPS